MVVVVVGCYERVEMKGGRDRKIRERILIRKSREGGGYRKEGVIREEVILHS